MPTVAVYVPAHVFRALGEDADLVRQVSLAALDLAVASGGAPGAGLGAEGPEAAGAQAPVSAAARETGAAQTSRVSPEPAVKERAPSAPSSSCRRFKMHHTNHSGRPCPECGYPKTEGVPA